MFGVSKQEVSEKLPQGFPIHMKEAFASGTPLALLARRTPPLAVLWEYKVAWVNRGSNADALKVGATTGWVNGRSSCALLNSVASLTRPAKAISPTGLL